MNLNPRLRITLLLMGALVVILASWIVRVVPGIPTFSPENPRVGITVTLQASPDVVQAGEEFTVTVTVTNTSDLAEYDTRCTLLYAIGDIGTHQPTDDPVFTLVSEDTPIAHGRSDLLVGEVQTCIFVLRAERPATLLLQGSYGGKVYFGETEGYGGNVSDWHTVEINPAAD